jgi:hypothetical protein
MFRAEAKVSKAYKEYQNQLDKLEYLKRYEPFYEDYERSMEVVTHYYD